MAVDIVCVGFGPAMGGFLTTLSRQLVKEDGTPALESAAAPGMPPQVICYERADDIGFGVSGVVTPARSIKASFPQLDPAQIPMAAPVKHEKIAYLLDPVGASRRSFALRSADTALKAFSWALPVKHHAFELPWAPAFLQKHDGLVLSMGQFMQWVGAQVMGSGTVQVWPSTPVASPLVEDGKVVGVKAGDDELEANVVILADGVNSILGEKLGLVKRISPHNVAVGAKELIELPQDVLESRFNLQGDEGMAWMFAGTPSDGRMGGGFLYTNKTSISLGVKSNKPFNTLTYSRT